MRKGSIYELSAPVFAQKLPGFVIASVLRPLASIFQVARARQGLAQ